MKLLRKPDIRGQQGLSELFSEPLAAISPGGVSLGPEAIFALPTPLARRVYWERMAFWW